MAYLMWRCRSCGWRHSGMVSLCPYTNIPREWQ